MSKIYVTADPHFGHKRIIDYANRPFAYVKEMNNTIIRNWNQTVLPEDTVFLLGDVSFLNKEKTKEIISKLNGYKVLILGNHDRSKPEPVKWFYAVGFDEIYKYPIILDEYLVLSHEPPTFYNPDTPYGYIYGHVHNTDMYQTLTDCTACVSMERWNYTPVSLDAVVRKMKKAPHVPDRRDQ